MEFFSGAISATVLTHAGGASAGAAARTAIVPVDPAAAPAAVVAAAAGEGSRQALATLDDMRGLLQGFEQKIRAEVRAEVTAAVVGMRPLSEQATKARVPEGFKWRKETHEARYLAQVKVVEPLEQLEGLLENFQAVDPAKGESYMRRKNFGAN